MISHRRTSIRSSSSLAFGAALTLSLAMVGCAATPAPQHVRADALGTGTLDPARPIVVEFQEGDTIPLELVLEGPFVRTSPDEKPILLRVARHFFLKLDGDGIASSVDGVDFDRGNAEPGRFQFGVSVTKEGVAAKMQIRTPTPEGLPPPVAPGAAH